MSLVDRDLVAEEREAARRAAAPLRAPRRSGMDEGTRWLALVAGGIGTLLVVTVGGWSLLGHHAQGGIPVIEPLPGPVRVKPVDPGGMQVMSTQVAQTNGPAAEALAPGPEAADPQALQAEVEAARHADAPAASASATAPAVAASAQASPGQNAPAQTPPAQGPQVSGPTAPAPVAVAPVQPQAAAPVPGTAAPDDKAGDDASANPDASAAAAPTPEAGAPAASGGHSVQLAALDSEAAARAEWARLARRAPSLFARREPAIVPVSRDGRRFFRLRTAGFNSVAEATAFCGRLHGAGVACTLADF